ncbi:MAG: serine/threonine protein kinase, partial [Verrucomicrobia bacterium]|nr:serine/threonine protein kinase [Verrucomicrobiota bacterium]
MYPLRIPSPRYVGQSEARPGTTTIATNVMHVAARLNFRLIQILIGCRRQSVGIHPQRSIRKDRPFCGPTFCVRQGADEINRACSQRHIRLQSHPSRSGRTAAMKNLIGQTLGDYRIESVAGRGGMGVVYRARQISLNRTVALKVLAPHLAENPAYIERLKREATAAAALSHQNIVHVYAASTTDDLHYFVMEYVEGETLHDRLAREGPMPPDEALAACVYLAQALDYAWKKAQIIHRDLKPGNVFISTDGEVKLGDLGLAKSVSEGGTSMTQSGQTVGTAYYMSPEQARGERTLDFRSDIYSLGCTLYQMLTGRYPYEGTFGAVIAKQITEPPPAILQVLPTWPMPVVLLLNK